MGAAKAFIILSGDDSNEFTISVDNENAIVGDYPLKINIVEDIKGVSRRSSISLTVEIVNSTAVEETSNVEEDKDATSKDADTSSNTAQTVANEERSAVLFNSGFIVTEARIASWDKAPALKSLPDIIKELNSQIKPPIITKVTNLGGTSLDFSN